MTALQYLLQTDKCYAYKAEQEGIVMQFNYG